MSITVDTVQLRFHIKPDYDQQQIQQLQSDLKQSQKNIEAERKVMEKYARTLYTNGTVPSVYVPTS